MNRYQILIEYEGTKFLGWQIQPKGKSIQKTIQNVLAKLLKTKINLIGAGRTDAGVHAIEHSAHFDIKKKILNSNQFIQSVNFFLNKNLISILSLKRRKKSFHSRYSAKYRIYKYVIFNRLSSPSISKNRGWHVKKKIDLGLLRKGAKLLEGNKDFSTYRASSCSSKSPIRTINYVKIKKIKDSIEIRFKSKSFLQHQVRSMVGCLKYLGEKKWDIKKFENVLRSKKRTLCAPPAPSHGLFLEKIIY